MNDPRTIGRYQIRGELGRGMMGVVYDAHDPLLGRDVALKAIQLASAIALGDRESFEQRFLAEARSAARLAHPGIVVVHDVGRDAEAGTLFMAMERLRGETLDRVLKRGPLPWRDALTLAKSVAEALHHAHANGVIHRDVKPANLMLQESGEPKIMDFGIAKLDTSQLTATGQFLGTPLYMSPEQAQALPVDARSDLFALGSVLYEMLTGRAAFAGETVTKILFQLLSRDPAPLAVAGLPAGVDHVLARCLAKDPARRHSDARALALDLEDVLAGRPPRGQAGWQPAVTAGGTIVGTAPIPMQPAVSPPTAVAPSQPAPPRRSLPLGLVALLLATLVAGGIGWRTLRAPPVARRVEPAEPAPATPAPERAAVKKDESEPARLSLSFEHSLKSGSLKVWVDDLLVIEEDVGGRVTRDIAGLKMRKGRLEDALEVAPGRREVKVQVAWEDNVKTESAWANFKAGSTLRLRVRLGSLGGFRKDLSMEWY